ncbi:MAG: fused MFS/spermidine synthase [Sporichthyaceae bacterium]
MDVVVEPDRDRASAYQLTVDGTPQSHVDLDDPTYLAFEYVRRLGHVVDALAAPGEPLAVVHLGAGGLTLARYVAATRPTSRQRAVEVSEDVAAAVRTSLPLGRGVKVPVQVADAREALSRMRTASSDLVVVDVFSGARTPAHLTSVGFVTDVRRVVGPAGAVAVNVADGPGLAFARGQVATYAEVFEHLLLVAESGVWRGRRFGNLVLLGSAASLPVAALTRRCAGDPVSARVVSGSELVQFATGARPVGDADAQPSPQPPARLFGAR